jgi:hypothetical protein
VNKIGSTAVTVAPVAPPAAAAMVIPEFIRLPKPGCLCPFTGLARSAMNDLVLPSSKNHHKPLVRSFCLRQKGAKTGIRLVDYESLRHFIRRHEETGKPHTDNNNRG